jgi:hypothetical protein
MKGMRRTQTTVNFKDSNKIRNKGEMNQALYAHMNNKRKRKKKEQQKVT